MPSCPHCRAPTEVGALFCGNCGQLVNPPESHAPTLADPVQARPHGAINLPATGDLIGREVIGQYVIRQKLGEGGMGEVYFADQPAMGRAVAIKVLHPHRVRGEAAQRFQQEAQAAARLQSPHIVQMFNYGDMGDGTLFLAMEFLAGRTLAELIRDEAPLDPHRAVKIARQCCEALQEAHEAGVVHRDLKPANLMLVQRGKDHEFVKVLDFGVAKLDGGDMTREGTLLGTPQYMSPEQFGSEAIDGRGDLYALGVILYEMLAGRPPFESRHSVGYINLHLNEPPPPLHGRVPGIPPALASVVMRALDKQPSQRPQTAAEFSRALAAAMAGVPPAYASSLAPSVPPGSAPSTPPTSAVSGPSSSATSTPPTSASWPMAAHASGPVPPPTLSAARVGVPASRGRAGVWIAVAVAVVVIVGGVGGWIYLDLHRRAAEAGDRLAELEEQLEAQDTGPLEEPLATEDDGAAEAGDESEPESESANESADGAAARDGAAAPPDDPPSDNVVPSDTGAGTGTAMGELSPEAEKLMALSVAELERELDAQLEASLIPPSSRQQIRDAYGLQKRMAAAGDEGERQLKVTLIQFLTAYDDPALQAKPGDRLPLDELIEVFMTMEMSNDLDQGMRQTILDNALTAYDDYQHPEDVEYLKRVALAGMIRSMAADPDVIDGKR